MGKFEDFLDQVKTGTRDLALELFTEYQETAIKESEAFFAAAKADLERWAKLLVAGELTREDFEWLVKGKKDLLDLHALKQAGLARVRIDKFRNGVLRLVIDKAFGIFV
jgi:hypothetical protein